MYCLAAFACVDPLKSILGTIQTLKLALFYVHIFEAIVLTDNFDRCLPFTLQYEGGFVWNPHDPGGPTCCGITQVTLSHELGRKATVTEVRALKPTDVIVHEIYHKKFWNVIDGDSLPLPVAQIAFDIAVNMGPGRVLPWLEASKNMNVVARIKYLHNKRLTFWKQLKIWATFWRGWTRREQACYNLCIKLAAQNGS